MQSISWYFSSPWDACIYGSIERELNQPSNTIRLFALTHAFYKVFLLQWHTNIKKKNLLLTRQKPYQLKGKTIHLKVVRVPSVAKKIYFTQSISESLPHPIWLHLRSCFCSYMLISIVKYGVEFLDHVISTWPYVCKCFQKVTYKLNHVRSSLEKIVL